MYNQFNNQTNSADDYIDCKITGSDVKLPVLLSSRYHYHGGHNGNYFLHYTYNFNTTIGIVKISKCFKEGSI